jgi:hypothetical protein
MKKKDIKTEEVASCREKSLSLALPNSNLCQPELAYNVGEFLFHLSPRNFALKNVL